MNTITENAVDAIGTFSPVPIYIINLKKRADRRVHIRKQFEGRNEFSLRLVEAFEHSFGPLGLWTTIRHILNDIVPDNADYVIIGEDDLEFTENYSREDFFETINSAKEKGADLLLGGVSWIDNAVKLTDNLFWVNTFNGTHLMIIYKDFIKVLRNAKWKAFKGTDYFICDHTHNVLFMHPFVAVQKEFGYSDATIQDLERNVDMFFQSVEEKIKVLNEITDSCKIFSGNIKINESEQIYDRITIPTYVINLPERTERLEHIKAQFADKPEFSVEIVEAIKHEVGALGLWLSIRKVIEKAIENEDDVIIISEDDHQFTEDYSKEYLLRNIIEANEEGACYLSGGTGQFQNAVPITKNRYWVAHCLSTQFVVIYKKFFQRILDMPYDEKIIADIAYSSMTSNKMVIYPFVSTQKDFGYSDITALHNDNKELVTTLFMTSNLKLEKIQKACLKHNLV